VRFSEHAAALKDSSVPHEPPCLIVVSVGARDVSSFSWCRTTHSLVPQLLQILLEEWPGEVMGSEELVLGDVTVLEEPVQGPYPLTPRGLHMK
jgi:hypothetical protein